METPDINSLKCSNGELALELLPKMEDMTWDRFGELWIKNAESNLAFADSGRSIAELCNSDLMEGSSAVVIAAGPSLKRKNPAQILIGSDYNGTVVATESAMSYCLRNGLIPDLVVTLDPHHDRVVRWFGLPDLTETKLKEDDYFARQDQDDAFADEMRANEEIIELLEIYGNKIKIAMSTSASQSVVKRAIETGMDIFWWNPMIDDPDESNSKTTKLQNKNGFPAINAGGNVGTACWLIADAVLEKRHVALTGVDFSYYDGTPYRNTQYFHEAVNLVGEENLDSLYLRIYNPYVDAWFFTDPAYMWYRQAFLEMQKEAECVTYNCTEGGVLFGKGIKCMPLANFIKQLKQ